MKFAGRSMLRGAITVALVGSFAVAAPLATHAQELEEITVIARKKDENLQDVPLAVSAITASMVEQMGIANLDDIAKMTAGLQFDPEFNRTSNRPVIRGQANILGDSGVSYFIDGVYITGSINDYDINDVERVEIVKGPQSALYGRNTYSGAINIITKSPGDTFSARGLASATDDGQQEFSATLKGPLGESFGIGITGRYFKNDGPFTNTFDGSDIGLQESTSMSAVATLNPSDRFSARARIYYNETDDGQSPLALQPTQENNCFFDTEYDGGGRYFCGTLEPRPIASDWSQQAPDTTNYRELTQASLAMDFQLTDTVSLASVTGFNSEDSKFIQDGDYAPDSFQHPLFATFPFGVPPAPWSFATTAVDFTFANEDEVEDFSQEFRLSWQGERSEYLVGLYYFDQTSDSRAARVLPSNYTDLIQANYDDLLADRQAWCASVPFLCTFIVPPAVPTLGDQNRTLTSGDITNTALFAMGAFDIGDATRLTLEARFARDEIESFIQPANESGNTGPSSTDSAEFDSFNPRITVDHRFNDDQMVYALYARGNKPGGFNGATAANVGFPTFDEETVDSIEFGLKNTLFEGQLVFNASMFFNQIEGYQLTQNVADENNLTSAIVNAGDADIFGVELETRWYPTAVEGLSITANYAFNDNEFTRGVDGNQGQLDDVADNGSLDCSTGNVNPNPPACTPPSGSIVGNRIPRTAEHQFFLDAEIRRPMGSGDWTWFIGANYAYESEKFTQVLNLAEYGESTLVNARLGFDNDRYSVMLWGRNLTGEDSSPLGLRYLDVSGNDGLFRRAFVISARRDTYWGLTASVDFE